MQQQLSLLEAIGAMADSFHRSLGLDRVSWGWRMIIAFFLVDVIDIAVRVITLPLLFSFPLASHAVHIVFNTIIAFACAALWGMPGLIHLIDLGFGLIPGIFGDMVLDILPLATIAGLVARWRGEVLISSPTNVVRNGGAMLRFTIFIATVMAMWWFGCFSLFSFGWWSVVVISFLFITGIAQSSLRVAGGTIMALTLVIVIFFAGLYLGYLSLVSPESYREATWTALEEEGDARIKAARQADATRTLFSKGVEAVAGAGRATLDAAEKVARGIDTEVGSKIGEALLDIESDTPAWDEFSHWLGGKLAPEKKLEREEKEKKQFGPIMMEPGKQKEEAEAVETEDREGGNTAEVKPLSGPKRGPAEIKLYESSYILGQVESLLEKRKCWTKNLLILSLGLLAFILVGLGFQGDEENSTSSEPSPKDDDDETLSL